MSLPSRPPAPRRSRLRRLGLLALAALAVALPTPARAGWDDFEFGQRLIEKGYLEYAKRVFETILNDEKRPQQERDRARYGMALLGKADAVTAINNPTVPWSEATNKLDAAIDSIDGFVKKFPDDPQADRARFETAGMQQWFVEQSSELSADAERLTARGAKAGDVLEAATRYADKAIETYRWLSTKAKSDTDKALANYYLAVMGYYKALTAPKCSSTQLDGLKQAQKILEDYAFDNDGKLTQVFAQDFQGQALWAVADCLSGKEQWQTYQKAMSMFIACASTEDQGDDHRKVIALGYYHIGKLANAVAKTDQVTDNPTVTEREVRDILKEARRHLGDLERRAGQSRLDRMDYGLRAMVEWGLVEWRLGAGEDAIRILNTASESATSNGLAHVAAIANAALARVARGTAGGDPAVLFKIAENGRTSGKFEDAIAAYRNVIKSASATPENLRKYVYPSWVGVAQSYQARQLIIEAAAAYEVLIDEESAGRLTPEKADAATKKLMSEAYERQRALATEIFTKTGDAADKRRRDEITNRVIERLPKWQADGAGGGSVSDLAYRRGRELFAEAVKLKDDPKQPKEAWQKLLREARGFFTETAKQTTSEYQDPALVYLVRVEIELEQWDDAVKAAAAARAAWATDAGKRKVADNPSLAGMRRAQAAAADYWEARAQVYAGRPDEALKLLDGFATRHPDGGDYGPIALGLRCDVLAEQGKVAEAEAAYRDLLTKAPDYPKIPAIVAKLAKHYQEVSKEIQGKIDAVQLELLGPVDDRAKGVRAQRIAADKEESQIVEQIAAMNQTIARLEAWFEFIKGDGVKFGEEEKRKNEAELAAALEARKKARVALAAAREKIDVLAKRAEALTAQRTQLQLEQVPSMRRAAELYLQLDEALQKLDAANPGAKPRRTADDVGRLAYRYYLLARNDPATKTDLVAARDLFEQYFAMPEVKALPEHHQNRRTYARITGDVWYRLAEQATGDDAKKAYQKALVYLEPYAARNPVNAAIVRLVLRGEVAVLRATDFKGQEWPVPVRK
ncbi:MAG: tetratricopeptide repeat protein, partial [Planctomycetia bacterium]|nr:tetratricopeptide repeat protein [Planctomycetia bacterium]